MRIDEDGYRRHMRRCLWTCVCSILVAAGAFATMFLGPDIGDGTDAHLCTYMCFASFVFTVSAVLCVFALLLMALTWLCVRICRAVSARGESGPHWKCDRCGNVELSEREVRCWQCGDGEMIYHES